ncbi:hypothetical protein BDZ97DRAFT_1840790 [Flammula alnicola]|nr:hypothetical protein BDZ97DRAFT_1840790 [Flammula alnicola]
MYNGRPHELTAPPIEIYHPVFATFRRKIAQPTKDFKFSAAELGQVHTLIVNSLAFYDSEDARKIQLDVLRELVHQQVLDSRVISNGGGKKINPDGAGYTTCQNFPRKDNAAILFTELKNGVGEGGSDPISQSQCDYIAFYSADLRQPSFSAAFGTRNADEGCNTT